MDDSRRVCGARARAIIRALGHRWIPPDMPLHLPRNQAYAGAMEDNTGVDEHRAGGRFVHFVDWLNHKLVGVMGPPPLGPYDEVLKKVGEAVCPVCGRPMSEH